MAIYEKSCVILFLYSLVSTAIVYLGHVPIVLSIASLSITYLASAYLVIIHYFFHLYNMINCLIYILVCVTT